MKKLSLLFAMILALAIWGPGAYATHLMGADMTWTIVGPHQYIVTLDVYRDCNSAVVQPTSYVVAWKSVTCSDTGSFTVSVASGYPQNATDTCPSEHSSCDGGSVYGVQKWEYVSGVVDLPASCPDVILSWASGDRNVIINNLTNPGNDALYISAEINTSIIDNSPQFLNPLTVDLCLDQTNYVNQGGYDPDGDSLVYVLDTAQGTLGAGPAGAYPPVPTALAYAAGYTPTDPITNTYFNFNSSTGQITVFPTQSEYDVVKLVVYEYRSGVLVGHVERDMQVEIASCADTLPSVSGIDSITSRDSVYTMSPCATSCFTVYSFAADTNKVLTVSVTGQSSFPGATFTISSGKHPTLTFCWTPTRANAGTFRFYVTVKDNNCPQPGSNTQSYTVIVPEIYPAGPDQTICQYNAVHTESTGVGTWTIESGNPATTVIASPTSTTSLITGFTVAGRYNYIWTSDTLCVDTMSIFVTAKPNAGADQTVCQYGVATMAATGGGTWHALPGNPATTVIADSFLSTTTITGFTVVGTYQYSWTSGGCSDTTAISVVLKPNGGPNQNICSSTGIATMAATGTGTWTASASNPDSTHITTPTSPTTTITGLAVAGTYTYYWGSGCEDTVLVTVATAPNGGPAQTICQYNTVRMGATGAGTWTSLSNNPATTTIVTPASDSTVITGFTAAGTYHFVWSLGTGCTDTVAITVTAKPNAGADQSICINSIATMAATGTGTWTKSAGNPDSTHITNTTSPTTTITNFGVVGVYTYYWTANGCTDTVLITVTALPNAGPDQSLCAPGTITTAATGTGTWSALSTNPGTTTITNIHSAITTITGFSAGGTYTYVWANNGCTDSMSVLVTPINSAGPDQAICQYNTVTTASIGTGTWSILSTNPATTVIANIHSDSTTITGFTVAGIYGYVWSSSICTDTMLVTVTAKPNAGLDQSTCQYSTATMAATGTGTWTAISTNPATTTIVTPASATTEITGFAVAGTYGYVWTSNGCTDTADVIVTAKPNAGADQTICQYTTATMTASGRGAWSTPATGNPAVVTFANDTVHNTVVSGFTVSGTYTLIWSFGGCADTVLVHVTAKPNAGPDQVTCQYSTATMAATGTGAWTTIATNPATTTIVTPASATTEITGFTVAGTYGYVWTSNGCTDTADVIVTAKPNAGSDQTICQYTTTALAATGRGTWSTPATGNPAVITFANDTLATTSVSGFTAAGNYLLIWSFNGCSDTMQVHVTAKPNAGPDETTCQYSTVNMAATGAGTWTILTGNPATTTIVTPASATTEITGFTVAGRYGYIWTDSLCTDTAYVTVVAKPNAGSNQTICQYTTTVLAATGRGTWTAQAGNPATITFVNDTLATTSVSGFTVAGNYNIIWSFNGCTDTMQIHVTAKPNAGPDETTCQYSTVNMAASGLGTWTILAGNPATTTIVTPASPTTEITGFTVAGTYGYIWTDSSCTDTAYVTVNPKPNAGTAQTICQYTTATMDATGTGTWSHVAGNPATVTFTTPASPTSVVSGFTVAGVYTLIWTSNGCADSVLITVTAKPNAGPDQTTCQFSTATMAATGTGVWTALSTNPDSAVIVSPDSAHTEITGFDSAGTYSFVWTSNGCTDTANVIVHPKPNAGPDQHFCIPGSTVLDATGGPGIWTALSTDSPSTIVSPTSDTTVVNGFTTGGYYSYIWTVNGCADTTVVTVYPTDPAGPNQTVCQYDTVKTASFGAGTWIALSNNPNPTIITDSILDTTTIAGFNVPGTYGFVWLVNPCTDTMFVTVVAKPNAGPDQTTCQFSTATMGGTGTGTWTAMSGNPDSTTIVTPSSPNTVITGFDSSGTYRYIWTANGCTDTASVIVTAKPNAGSDQTICQFTTTTLAATGRGTWTTAPGNPAVLTFANDTLRNTSVSGFSAAGNYILIWSFAGCSDSIEIHVTAKPNAGPDQTTCQFSTTTMAASGSGTWTAMTGNPHATTIVTPASPTTEITGFTVAGDYSYIWTDSSCSDTALVIVVAKPNAGSDQVICQYTTTVLAATGHGTWSVAPGNPDSISFANDTLATTVVSGFDTAGTNVLIWTFDGCSDTMLIHVTPKPNAGPAQITCQYSTATMAATGLGTWTVLAGNPATTTIVTPASPTTEITGFTVAGTYGYIWTDSSCTDTAYVTVTAKPNAGSDQTICQYTTTTLAAAGRGTWSTPATGNPAVITFANDTLATTAVSGFTTAGNYILIWSFNGCSDSMEIHVTAKPNAGADQTTCQFSTVNMAAAGTGTWTVLTGNPATTVIVAPGSPNTEITGFTVAGTYGYIWTDSLCTDTAYVTVTPKPDAGPDQTICQYTTTVMAATGSGLWTAAAGNPAVITFTNDTVYNTTASGFSAAGTYALYWTLNGCSDTVLVNVTAKPDAGPDQTTCQFSTATMAATGTGTWTALSTNPVVTVIVTPTSPNTEITGFDSAGTYSYVWTSDGCTDTANVIVNQKSNGGPNQSFCLPGSTALDGLNGPGLWTALSSNPGSSTIVSPTSDTTVVNGITLGGYYYYIWTVNGCADTVQVIAYPTDPAGPDQTICQYNAIMTAGFGPGTWVALSNNPTPTVIADSTADTTAITGFNVAGVYGFIWEVSPCTDTLYVTVTAKPDAGPDQTTCQYSTATMAGTGAGTWTAFASNPATTVIVSPASPTTVITGFDSAGTYSYIWTNNGCTDTANVTVTAKPNAGPDQTICQYSTTGMAATGTGTWTAEATNPGVVTFANNTSPTTSVSGFTAAGSYDLYWSLNGCSDTMVVTVTAKPDAGPDQVTCQYSTAVMAATGTGTWTAMIGNPATTVIVTPASPNTEITGFVTAGTYSYIWTNNGCADTATVTVTAKPNAGPDQTICQYEATTMAATGSGTWTLAAGNPSVLTITNTTSPTTTVSGFSLPGTDTLYWSLNGCSDTVLVNVTAKPNAGPDQNICQSTTATMAGSAGAGTWTQIGTAPAVAIITTPGSPTTTITGFTVAGTYSFIWTVNGCSDTMNVTVSEATTLGVSGAPAFCLGVSDTLTAVVTVPGGTYLWSPGGATTASIIVSPAPAGTYTYTVTYTLPVCGAVTAAASITVYPAMTLTTENDTICDGSNAHLTTTPSTAGGSYLWTPGNFNTQSITVTPNTNTIYTVTYTLAGCPATSISDTVDVTIPPTVSLTGGSICLGDSMTLTATPSQAGGTYTWSPGGATTQGITVSPATTTTYTVSYAIPGSVCPPTTATATVNVTPQPTVTVNDTSVCQGQNAYLTATPSIAGGTYLWTPGNSTTQNISVSPAATATYSVTYTIGGCGSATNTSGGVVTVNDPPVINALNVQPITCYDSTNGTLTPVITPAAGTYTYAWSNGETSPVDMDLAAGTYLLTITDANGCTATSALSGTIPAAPAEAFAEVMPNDITVLQDSSIQLATSFTPSAYTITGYTWTPGDGLSCTNCANPIVNTTDAKDTLVSYTVMISYNNGCYAYAYDTIHVEAGMAIGNAFTPNGDGKNDFFTVMARGANTFSMTIYNRWGQQMFSSNDITVGWDGNYKGSPQPAGDYIYYVEINYLNGQTTNRTGTVTLLR